MRYFVFAGLFLVAITSWGQSPASSGTIITIAGSGSRGFSGDGGPATNAAISEVAAIAVGPDGTIYFVDGDNYRIRAIDPVSGYIRTVAGNGIADNTGNGGPATNASISQTTSLATDRARNVLYLSQITERVVRRLNLADGTISIYAGTGTTGFTGDGGPATSARLRPWGLATDAAGRLSIAAQFRVRQVNPITGIINTIAGGDNFDFSPDGFPAVSTSFHGITELAADPAGNVFIFEGFSNEPRFVRRVDVVSGLVSTVAGGGTNAPGTGVATNMEFIGMFDIGVSAAGELFIAMNFDLFRVDLATGLIAPIAGNGTQGFGGDGGPALSAQFNNLAALAVIPGGGVVVADMYNYRIRYIVPDAINLTNDNGQTSFALPWVNGLSGDLILQNNPNLTNINLATLTTVSGDLVLGGNGSAGTLDLGSLQSANNVFISGNTAAGVLDLSSLATVSGDLILEGNTSVGNLDLGSLESVGNVSVSGNTAAGVLDLSALRTVSGDLILEGNASAGNLDLGSLETVSGDLAIEGNTSAGNLDLSSLEEVSGDLSIESNAPNAVINLAELTEYGCGPGELMLTLNGGTVEMTNGLTLCTNATLTGSTTVDGSITNNGTIEPGSSPGRLNITENLRLNSASRLHLEVGGYGINQFDVVSVGGSVTLGGNLTVRLLNSFTNGMTNGASFTVLTAGGPLAGSFANVASGGTLITADGRGLFTVRYAGENTLRLTELQLLGQPSASSGTVITIAGNGSVGYSGDGGPATNAALNGIEGLAFGPDGTLYIADSGNLRIRALDPVTGIIRTIAGTGAGGNEGNDGPATNATFSGVIGLATDRVRNALYVNDWANNWVRKVNLGNGILTLYAGSGDYGFSGDGGPATAATLVVPIGAAIDGAGRLSFIDLHNDRIRRVDPVSGIITTIAGSGVSGAYLGDGGPATGAAFGNLIRLTADRAGNVYLRDGHPNGTYFTVRRIDAASGIITTIVGKGTNAPGTGVATNMFFNYILELAANDAGELFVGTANQVFKLNLATGLIAPYAGDGTSGFTGDGGPALNAKFDNITALATAPGGGLVIAESDNGRIRYVAPDSINLTGDSGQTSFSLPWVSALSGNLILENNSNLTNINLATLTTVSGDLVLGGNGSAGTLDLGSLQSANNVFISGNTAAGVLDLSSLATVSGDLILEGNTSVGNLDLGSLESAGNVSVSGNTAAGVLDLSALTTVSGDLILEGNASAGNLDLGSLETVSGDLVIEGNTSAGNLDLSSLEEVSGDLTIESNAPNAVINLAELIEYGCGVGELMLTLNGGTVEMTNGLTLCTNATLTGSTTVDGSITNNGTIEPGASPGQLNITGNLHLNSASRLHLEIAGFASNEFDSIHVGQNGVLNGTVSVSLFGNFKWVMTNGASFAVMTAGASLSGAFTNAASGATITTTDGYARFTLLSSEGNSVQLTDLEIVDTDSDGMPDWWEDHFGLSKTNVADAEIDFDGDGASNRNEFLAGTAPNNPASVLRILAIQREAGDVRLTWSTVGSKNYRVQTNSNLTSAFTDFSPVISIPGSGESTTSIVDTISSPNARYYRVRIEP